MYRFALIAAVALCSCSRSQTYSTKDGTVTVSSKGKDDSSVHVTGKDGSSVDFNSGKPITDYPSDAPLYSGKAMMDMKSEADHSRVVAIQTSDSLEKIAGFYKSELEGKGWKTQTSMNTPQMTMYVAEKGERKLMVQISADDSAKMQTVSQTLTGK